jgi:UDP-glucose 4-epimerase
MMKIALTGASGFVGKRFADYNQGKYSIRPFSLQKVKVYEIDFSGIDTVVHLAGKAHEMRLIPDQVYYDVNYQLTKELAERAKDRGVSQFVFISSTKVYGDVAVAALNEQSTCNPEDAYGRSKYQAEELLRYLANASFRVAIIRPPLVYGPGVKGNMLRLLDLASKDIPLPFGRSGNARSIVFVDNLIELINIVIDRQASGLFIAGDQKPVSSDELIRIIRLHMGKTEGLLNVPGFIRTVLRNVKPGIYSRLFGSFVVDNSETNKTLGFVPPYSTGHGIEQMVKCVLNRE